jgi:hypothetical protein
MNLCACPRSASGFRTVTNLKSLRAMFMNEFTTPELEAAQKALQSIIRKSEKVRDTLSQKQPPRIAQLAMVSQRLKMVCVASWMINKALNENIAGEYSKEELKEALQSIPMLRNQIEKVQSKFKEGTPQHTLAVRRIRAFNIAVELIEKELAIER